MQRSISEIVTAPETPEGAGAMVKRAMPYERMTFVDPFVLLDEFFVRPPAAFPEHPHRGFEIITYMLTGSFRHSDSMGNDSTVQAGGLQRITAGSGIRHSEMPMSEGLNHGLQLWINLAQAKKGIEASYQPVASEEIPEATEGGAQVRTIAGPGSPVQLQTDVLYYDVSLPAAGSWQANLPAEYAALVYVLSGSVAVGDGSQPVLASQMAVLGEGEGVQARAEGDGGTRFVLIAGRPHGEPVRFRGPYVD